MSKLGRGQPQTALRIEDVSKSYVQAEKVLNVLSRASMYINQGEIVALVGPSGAGKSTLLHLAGLLDSPTQGNIFINNNNVTHLDDESRTRLRRDEIGFVYQFHHLLPEFSAQENVMMPQLVAGVDPATAMQKADYLLARMGLSARREHRPAELSGGEQQRVAICRAIANDPALLLADEPTGNLDPETSDLVFDQLLALVRQEKVAALIATHNMELAKKMDRRVTMRDGKLISA
jgi:lipoprotein-releasing system ATP-binding protein